MDTVDLKVRLQSLGVRLAGGPELRRGGAGPAEGLTLVLEGLEATVPVSPAFVRQSPFCLVSEGGAAWVEAEDGRVLGEVEMPADPAFYSYCTGDGTPMGMVAARHSRDCVGSTLLQECCHVPRCGFCAIDLSLERGTTILEKSPEQLFEVARAADAEGFSHAVLTTGTPAGGHGGLPGLLAGAAALREARLAVHIQFEPPSEPGLMDGMSGPVTSAGIHIESFDEGVRERLAPGKCARSLETYVQAWNRAVELLGAGKVSSFIIAGLGENDHSILEGTRLLTSLGVYPFILPLRPIPGTPLGEMAPPSPDRMFRLYEAAAGIIDASGLRAAEAGAGCVRCGGCSAITHYTA